MKRTSVVFAATLLCVVSYFSHLLVAQITRRPDRMTFFVTSVGMGDGGNLGGLAGADKRCEMLAQAAGAPPERIWRAYLSTRASGNRPTVNARDRIGGGPWYNAVGAEAASNLALLHGDLGQGSVLNNTVAVTERGRLVSENMHDILTGTQPNGLGYPDGMDRTCNNWTSNGAGSAQVGHSDVGSGGGGLGGTGRGGADRGARSWNSSHATSGCSQEDLESSGGGAGLFYCFAIN